MRNGRRLGKEVDARILAAATRDAIVTGQAIMRAMAAASGFLSSTLQHVLAVHAGAGRSLRAAGRQEAPGSIAGARVDIWNPPAS